MTKTRTAPWDYARQRISPKALTTACPNCGEWAMSPSCFRCGYQGEMVIVRELDADLIKDLVQDAKAKAEIKKTTQKIITDFHIPPNKVVRATGARAHDCKRHRRHDF